MNYLLDDAINKGLLEGKNEANRQTAINLIKNGVSLDTIIASIPDLPKDEIQKIFDSITQNEAK